jgi:hypothetical protein
LFFVASGSTPLEYIGFPFEHSAPVAAQCAAWSGALLIRLSRPENFG